MPTGQMPDERNAHPDSDPPFLDPEPPHWAARGLATLLMTLFAASIVAALVIRVPERVSGPFVLVPAQGGDPVRASRDGIVTGVRAAEGASVAAGDTLFQLRSDPVGDRSAELLQLRSAGRAAEESRGLAEREYATARLADDEAARSLESRLASLGGTIGGRERQLAIARELAERYERGAKAGAIGAMEAGRARLDAETLAEQLEAARSERATAASALRQRRHESEARRVRHLELVRRLEAEREQASLRVAALERELSFSAGNELTVPAPCAGTVLRVRVNTPGAVVHDGDTLAEVACSGSALVGELSVPASGVAYLRAGQGVKLLYDAFPYQRHGVREGRVRWVGPAGIASREGGFRALIEIDSASVLVRGTPRPLLAGMGGRADVVIGRRTLASYAVEPIRQLRESMREPTMTAAEATP